MIKFVTVVDSFLYLKSIIVNPALSPPSQISPLPLISPPFQGKKVNKPPSLLSSPLPTPNYSSLIKINQS